MEYAADMLTYNTRKSTNAEASMKPERGKSGRVAQTASPATGPILRERREAMGVTLAEAEVATRIRQKYLAALESDEWDLLPGEVVGRGFLRNYSTYLGIEPTEMIERRRAMADESLTTVLADTSAGSPLPPERAVDYRPKDVALHDESEELESPRRINLMPLVVVLSVAALAALVWWSVTQLGDEISSGIAAVQEQVVAWQQAAAATPAPAPAPGQRAEEVVSLPENLLAPSTVTESVNVDPAAGAAAPAVEEAAPPSATEATQPLVEVAPTPEPVQQPEVAAVPAVDLLALLPTPTPQPEVAAAPVAEATEPATVITAANLRQSPSTEAPVVGAATEGETLTIVGQTADGAWLQLENGAWIFAQLVNNPPVNLPVVETPTTP
jgi:cytoskeletal protein RodZ